MEREGLLRAFVAIDLEDPALARALRAVKDALLATGAQIKPVEDENMHITLRFLGEVPRKLVDLLCEKLRSAGGRYKPFEVEVVGIGTFPDSRRPRVVWAGIGRGSRELAELQAFVESVVTSLGLPREREEFVPHITLARVKGSANIDKLVREIARNSNQFFGRFVADRIKVKKSVLTPSGPIYSDVCVLELGK
ncbi:MAG: RNA 2',3'-cyclic phosphodiesterase [Desulfurococcaceae archaeon]